MTYKINVETLKGNILTFRVDDYEIVEGSFVKFTDKYSKMEKKFHTSRCEIEEQDE